MTDKTPAQQDLQDKLGHLEASERWHQHAWDLLSRVGHGFQRISHDAKPEDLFLTACGFLYELADFSGLAFFGLEEGQADFQLTYCEPASRQVIFERCGDMLIESGDFAWALKMDEPFIAKELQGRRLLLHAIRSGKNTHGLLIALLPPGQAFGKNSRRLLTLIMQSCSHALEINQRYQLIKQQNRRLEQMIASRNLQLEYQSSHDTLTRLPNRERFIDRIREALERISVSGGQTAIILIGLDFFKRINENLGHSIGDQLLRQIASRLNTHAREYGNQFAKEVDNTVLVGHFGGDEFAVLLDHLPHLDQVNALLERLERAFSKPFFVGNHEIIQSFSSGISYAPDQTRDAAQLLKFADVALYQAKEQGRRRAVVYDDGMQSHPLDTLTLSNKLATALNRQQFELYYQPQVNANTGQIIGLEALLRWQDSQGHFIPPSHFIPLAEQYGHITTIGDWVISEACRQIRLLMDTGYRISVSVNIASQQFNRSNFADIVINAVREFDVPAELLELELTERIVMANVEESIDTLNTLHDYGFKIAIDDFGTGYSSLSYLKRFPIDQLKIDKSFVDDLISCDDDAAIVTAIVAMANKLHIDTIAEGVETLDQVNFLEALGCNLIQGYYFSRPLSQPELQKYLKKSVNKDLKVSIPSA
ncbi:putative bifunctional diguanylate cyclase/phosphodiesterase [Pelagibaculum spongiae]|uniref:cyclic-guanylate-specific phosphodiesterase n=1 Tax=Pelagibaculum spongiae TaxID=2080658 RepID=A0A2V1GTR8_9GAMM|nr:EAL domain-containing protein [Pelagibaculum spongiae]PVZ65462.1 hypothetical protein DC094_18455 [Pelagibaculum spongiae]